MWNVRRAVALLATVLVAALIVFAFALFPPVAGFLLAVAAASAWCAWLDAPRWPLPQERTTMIGTPATPMRPPRPFHVLPYVADGPGVAIAGGAVAALTAGCRAFGILDPTIVALLFLLIVVVIAAVSSWRIAVTTSLLAFFAFNFFFLPPIGTLVIADAQHWVALFTLLVVSLVASYLSSEVRHRADEVAKAEVARHSAELKSSLLASLGHDLKTPLTALTVAADNLNASWLTPDQRREQADIVRAELARLNRLFQNLIDMARIESHAVTAEREWVTPAEIIEAAAHQVEATIAGHVLAVDAGDDATLVHLDPRLTSAALAHVLENAAQHSPLGSRISVTAEIADVTVRFVVRDAGRGLGRSHAAPGIGLSVSRGLLAAEGGAVHGENAPGGGAVFTVTVPAERRAAAQLVEDASA